MSGVLLITLNPVELINARLPVPWCHGGWPRVCAARPADSRASVTKVTRGPSHLLCGEGLRGPKLQMGIFCYSVGVGATDKALMGSSLHAPFSKRF